MQIKFLGAAGSVTGSCYVLTADSGQSIVIDCGVFQGAPELEKLNSAKIDCDLTKVSAMVLTHAHMDHCGRLPLLFAQGFAGPVFMTPPTKDITEISLLDSAKINNTDQTATAKLFEAFKTVEYENTFTIGDFEIIMRDAGHILGSASLEIKNGGKKIVFSGDLGNSPEDLIRATETINKADAVVMESTYGDSSHPSDDPAIILQSEINAVEASGGTLLIPVFSIERSQELLHRIGHLKKTGAVKPETTVIFDSPMAEKVTQVFEKYHEYFNHELETDFNTSDPFKFPGLAQGEVKSEGAKVIMAGGGMMTGGKIVSYAAKYLPLPTTRILFVGYQGEGTLGREIWSGQKTVSIEGTKVNIQAQVNQTQAMSSHADQPRLVAWLKNIQEVQKVFLTHGEDGPRNVLAEKIKNDVKISDVTLPVLNQLVTL